MEKIAFNIKYRADIEAGKYRIEARCGSAVRILCWDRVGTKDTPIVAAVNMLGAESIYYYHSDGTFVGGCPEMDLVLIPAENLDEIEAFDRWRSLHKQVTKRDCFAAGIAFAEGRLQLALKTGKNLPNWMILKIQEVEKFARESAEADQRSQLPHWFPVVEGLNFPRPARYLLESGGAMYYCSGETCPRNGYALLVDDLLNFPKDTTVPAGDGAVALADFSEQEKQECERPASKFYGMI